MISLCLPTVIGNIPPKLSATVLTPIEMIKCRMQATQEMAALRGGDAASAPRQGPLRLARSIIVNEGPLAPFKGLSAAIVREMVGYFFFFGVYEMVRESFTVPGGSKDDIGTECVGYYREILLCQRTLAHGDYISVADLSRIII